jgi:hypothetical protein
MATDETDKPTKLERYEDALRCISEFECECYIDIENEHKEICPSCIAKETLNPRPPGSDQ